MKLLRKFSAYFIVGTMLIGSIAPALADPEGDSPQEYIWAFYPEFDPETVIAKCKKIEEDASGPFTAYVNALNNRFTCLKDEIHKIWQFLFSDETRKERQLDAKLDQMIGLYANIYSSMAQRNTGCKISCGNEWIGHGVGKGVDILEDILRSTNYFLDRYPPVEKNPEFIEWEEAGRPPWPPQPEKR